MPRATKAAEQPIALVGLMGAGKTTVGRRLAARLALPFFDSDAEIEAAAGLTVREIFARFGEAHFRELERRQVARLASGPPSVIATGGGAFVDAGTRALLLTRCVVIWLDGDPGELAQRARRSGDRPLLDGGGSLCAEARNPLYAEAQFRVVTTGGADPVAAVLALLGRP